MFDLKMLGTAAGGGVPQWNCACYHCDLARKRPQTVAPRLQLQAAVSTNGQEWFLLNASPDLRFQIEANPELQPSPARGRRNTPILGIILTSADLDQVLGLLLLREFQPLVVYATALVRETLRANSFFRMLERVPGQLTWIEIVPGQVFPLGQSGILCTPVAVPGSLPFYAGRSPDGQSGQASLALVLECDGRRIAYAPSIPEVAEDLRSVFRSCQVILADGTFWSDAELISVHTGTPLARSIGHVPMGGSDGTIALLADLAVPHRYFIHINNTNPVLDPRSTEWTQVQQAGWQIGHDGWRLSQQL